MMKEKTNKELENNSNSIETNEEFKIPHSCEMTGEDIFNFQQRISSLKCSPLGECSGDMAGMTDEVEKDAMNSNEIKE